MKLLITGGGTGGHVNPGLAIAKYVQSRRPDTEIRFAGTATGIESRLVPREGYHLYTIEVRGLKRSLSPAAMVYNAATLQKSLKATREATKILKEFQPDAVIGCGGYASFPMVHAAQKLHIPTVLLEVNALPGVVTKSCAKKADRVLISFENTRELLDNRPNIHLTGAPVRGEIIFADRQKAREKLGLAEGEKLVASFWGSIGALYMNRHMVEFIRLESETDRFRHIHATGAAAAKWLPDSLKEAGVDLKQHPNIDVREYIYDMADVMAAADLVICRAGAATLGELCVMGKPSVIVPSPFVAENHQEKNARALEQKGACVVITEPECTAEKLYAAVTSLLEDEARLNAMGKAAAQMAIVDSSEKIYRHILEAVRK
ncbi:MAG: undecaprenyldiphospho-muramoylpentapeptide beta-N-acetylglucosaminyltransferase [Eubacteriales bacterium]|nr:undecaprenyldiphospho-muramoylpentapeptide beta-N-acetylglucosaminyltransferase [Eubacteriales bacterium]